MIENRQSFHRSGPSRPAPFLVPIVAVLALALAGSAEADWLVTVEGQRVQTAGPWEQKGRMIVFRSADGTLASMRASEVDLEASQRLTEAAKRQAELDARPKPAVKRESVLRLTDADVGHVDPGAPVGNSDSSETGDAQAGLAVTSWDRDYDDTNGGIIIRGEVRNGEPGPTRSISIFVILRNDAGTMVGRSRARLTRTFLSPRRDDDLRGALPRYHRLR